MTEDIKEKKWYVYILECSDGSFYTGVTNDVKSRMKVHAAGRGSKYVHSRGFKKLLHTKLCKNYSDSLKHEYRIKQLLKYEKIKYFN